MLRVFLNAHGNDASPTGIANYAQGLGIALADAGIALRQPAASALRPMRRPGSRLKGLLRDYAPGAYRLRRALEQRRFDALMDAQPCDLYHEPTLWPMVWAGPTVMTVHDLVHLRFPETQPRARIREIERHFRPALDRCAAVIVTSRLVRDELVSCHGFVDKKVFVAPIGVDPRLFRPALFPSEDVLPEGLQSRRFFLCAGTLEPRKNLTLAIDAHQQLHADLRKRFPLVIVGGKGWNNDVLTNDPCIRLTGYLGHNELSVLYRHARALVFPSLYEGFGLPVLEAMASGTPSLLHPGIAAAEVAGTTGIYVDGFTPTAWAHALEAMADSDQDDTQRDELVARSALFSWENCARKTLDAYHYALEHA